MDIAEHSIEELALQLKELREKTLETTLELARRVEALEKAPVSDWRLDKIGSGI